MFLLLDIKYKFSINSKGIDKSKCKRQHIIQLLAQFKGLNLIGQIALTNDKVRC